MTRLVVAAALFVAACTSSDPGGGGGGSGTPDAASSNKVVAVTCPTTADAMVTVTSGGGAFMPMTQTVPKNAVVKFVMTPTHDAAPNTLVNTDPGIVVGQGQTKCLKFTETGTYGFYCSAHSFAGTITVQ